MRVLVAIDDSEASANTFRFVGDVLGRTKPEISITLFHVVETLPDALMAPGIPQPLGTAYQQVIADVAARRKTEGERLLDAQANVLREAGIPSDRITVKLGTRSSRPESVKVATALAIIDEMNAGNFEVVCLGRRGRSSTQGVFPASMAEKILREAKGRTVWVVD